MNDIEYLQSITENNYESGQALRRMASILKKILTEQKKRKDLELDLLTEEQIINKYSELDLTATDSNNKQDSSVNSKS